MARVHLKETDNLAIGLDVESWLAEESIDWVVGQDSNILVDTGIQAPWLATAASKSGKAAYYRPPRRIYDERASLPTVEMYRALSQTLLKQEYKGMYLGYLPWPFAEREYQILRETGHPKAHVRSDKRYVLQPREGGPDGTSTTPERQVPVRLAENQPIILEITVADDLQTATGSWYIWMPITAAAEGGESPAAWVAGRYYDEYRREAEGWRISNLKADIQIMSPYDDGWVKTPMMG